MNERDALCQPCWLRKSTQLSALLRFGSILQRYAKNYSVKEFLGRLRKLRLVDFQNLRHINLLKLLLNYMERMFQNAIFSANQRTAELSEALLFWHHNMNADASRLAWYGYTIFAPQFFPAPCIKPALFEDSESDSLNQRPDSTPLKVRVNSDT